MPEDKFDGLIRQLASSNIIIRANSIRELVETGEPAVPALIEALKDKNDDVREYAAEVLGRIGSKRAVPALIEALNDGNLYVRWRAAWALGQIRDVRAVPALVNVLKNDKDAGVRHAAASTLRKLGDRRAVPAFIEALNDEANGVRWVAAVALGEMGDAEAALPLVNVLKKDTDSGVRHAAAEALVKIVPGLAYVRLGEVEELLRGVLEKAEGREEKKNLFDLLEKINERKNKILEPEAKKLKLPKIPERPKKPGSWRVLQ